MSTALMYAFGNRTDCHIVDEPFYGVYLKTHPDIDHPGREEVLATMPLDFQEVLDETIFREYNTPHVFFKDMAHHLDGLPWSFMGALKNVLLIRKPRALIASFARVINNPTMLDIGLALEFRIMEYFIDNKIEFVVVDSGDIKSDPKRYLNKLCQWLEIEFTEHMLNWPAGPRPEDGIWAKYWYKNVHLSTGFSKAPLSDHPFPRQLQGLLEEAEIYYETLSEYKI